MKQQLLKNKKRWKRNGKALQMLMRMLTAGTGVWARNSMSLSWHHNLIAESLNNNPINNLAKDAEGNIYAIGTFADTFNVGTITLISELNTGSTSHSNDIFVYKSNKDGVIQWAKKFGAGGSDAGTGIAVDKNNNIYIAGNIDKKVDFSPTISITSTSADAFFAKLDNNGEALWAKGLVDAGTQYGKLITLDASGNIFLTGETWSTNPFYLDPQKSAGSQVTPPSGSAQNFLTKYDGEGNYQWGKLITGTASSRFLYGLGVDAEGNVIVSGSFTTNITIGSQTLTSAGSYDAYVAKVAPDGTVLWAKKMGGTSSDYFYSIAIDRDNNIYAAGNTSYSATAADFNGTAIPMVNSENAQATLVKLSAAGDQQWLKVMGAAGEDKGSAVVYNAKNDNIYFAGTFANEQVLKNVDDASVYLFPARPGTADAFLLKYNLMGGLLMGVRYGSAETESVVTLMADGSDNDNVLITGAYQKTTNLDPTQDKVETAKTLNSASSTYLSKLTPVNIALPVRLSKFDAVKNGNTALLSWETTIEINAKGFYVERSADGSYWSAIGFIPAEGSNLSSRQQSVYTFTDESPLSGINLYRLKNTDNDGSYMYSGVRLLRFDEQNQAAVIIYPNPVHTGNLIVQLNNVEPLSYQITDLMGRRIRQGSWNNQLKYSGIVLEDLQRGNYFLRLSTVTGNIIQQFTKL